MCIRDRSLKGILRCGARAGSAESIPPAQKVIQLRMSNRVIMSFANRIFDLCLGLVPSGIKLSIRLF